MCFPNHKNTHVYIENKGIRVDNMSTQKLKHFFFSLRGIF